MAASIVPQPSFFCKEDGEPPADAAYLAFSRDHNEDDAARVFVRRFGVAPRFVFDGLGGLLKVGPVPEPVEVL